MSGDGFPTLSDRSSDGLKSAVRSAPTAEEWPLDGHIVAAEIDACFETAHASPFSGPEAVTLSVANARSILATEQKADAPGEVCPKAQAATLGDTYRLHLADPRHSRGHRTTEAYLTTQRWVEALFGADTPITSITREGCREFVGFLLRMPKHAHKRYPGLPLAQAVEATEGDSTIERINAAHINGYLTSLPEH